MFLEFNSLGCNAFDLRFTSCQIWCGHAMARGRVRPAHASRRCRCVLPLHHRHYITDITVQYLYHVFTVREMYAVCPLLRPLLVGSKRVFVIEGAYFDRSAAPFCWRETTPRRIQYCQTSKMTFCALREDSRSTSTP